MAERCQAITKSGKPCSATVVADGMCAWHAPSWEGKRRQWSAEGGRKRANRERAKKHLPAETLTTDELLAYLTVAFRGVLGGKLTPNVGNALGTLARTMAEIRKQVDIEERLAELEKAAGLHEPRRLA